MLFGGQKAWYRLSEAEQAEGLIEPFAGAISPVALFTEGDVANIYFNERSRFSPSDKALDSNLTPVGVGNHFELWQVLTTPAADAEGILGRQEIITWLIDNPDTSAELGGLSFGAARLKDDLTNFVNARYEAVHGEIEDDSRSARRHRGEQREKVDPEVAKQTYTDTLATSRALADQLTTCEEPFLQACGSSLKAVLEQAGPELEPNNVDQRVITNKFEPFDPVVKKATATVTQQAKETSAFPVFASHAQREGFVKVGLTDDASAQTLGGMWNLKFERTKRNWGGDEEPAQVANDTPISRPTVLLTGNNASGKTFHQEARLFAQLSAQSFGYAPAETAVIRPVRNIAVLERARTDAANELSAFGSEVKTLARALATVEEFGEDTLVISDEGFSTTSPEDQATLLSATHAWLRKNGAAILAATHNEDYVDLVEQQDPDALFHFPYDSQTDRYSHEVTLVPTFRLEAGKDDAHAIEVAKRYGLNQDILDRAGQYLEGGIEPVELPNRRWNRIKAMHPDTRRQKLQDSASTRALYLFANYSIADKVEIRTFDFDSTETRTVVRSFIDDSRHDTDGLRSAVRQKTMASDIRTRDPIYIYSGNTYGSGQIYAYDRTVTNFTLGGERSQGNQFIDEFLVTGAVFNPEEIAERQQLFTELIDPEKRAKVEEALLELTHVYHWATAEHGDYGWHEGDFISEVLVEFLDNVAESGSRSPLAIRVAASLARWQAEERGDDSLLASAIQLGAIADGQEARRLEHDALRDQDDSSERLSGLERQRRVIDGNNITIALAISLGLEGFELIELDAELELEQFIETYHLVDAAQNAINLHMQTLVGQLKDNFEGREQAIDEIDFEALSHHSSELRERILALQAETGIGSFSFMHLPNRLKQLIFFADKEPRAQRAVEALRSIDSVHMHNLANHFEGLLAAQMEGQPTGYDCGVLLKERLRKMKESRERLWSHDENQYLFSGLNYNHTLTGELFRARSIVDLAEAMDTQRYTPVHFNDTGAINVVGARNINKGVDDQEANDFVLNPKGQLHILTGANMSGKTFHLKQILFNQLMAQSTGYTAAVSSDVPLFSKIIYYDRPANEEGRDLSAFATEVTQWNRMLKELEGKKRALVIIDEPFSSTSPRYQAALTFALVEHLMTKGHTVVMATHHHQLADKLKDMYGEATDLAHFEINKEGDEVTFSHKKQEGHAPSDAIAVARSLGGSIMRRVLEGL